MSDFTKAICGDWLNGKTVIVTGASGGMGAAFVPTKRTTPGIKTFVNALPID